MSGCARRPLVGIGVCAVLGTWIGLARPVPAGAAMAAAALAAAAAVACDAAGGRAGSRRFAAAGVCLTHLAVCCVACASAAARGNGRSSLALEFAAVQDGSGATHEVVGRVVDDPEYRPCRGGRTTSWRFTVSAEAVRDGTNGVWRPASGLAAVHWFASLKARPPAYGERWLLAGVSPSPPYPPGASRRAGGVPALDARRAASRLVSPGHGSGVVRACYRVRRACAGLLAYGVSDHPQSVSIMRALLLGYRASLPQDVKTVFRNVGTLHIIAISGSHVVVMAGILAFALAAAGLPRVQWAYVLAPALAGYTLATGMQPSAVRACIMALAYWGATLMRRQADMSSALGLAAVAILAWRPDQLFDLGFIFSFLVVMALVTFYPLAANPLGSRLGPDPLRVAPEPLAVVWLRAAARAAAATVATSFIAWVASAPVSAYTFRLFSPVSLLSNIPVIPLSSLILAAGCLSLLTGSCVPFLADVFNHANVALVGALLRVCEWAAAIPGGYFETPEVRLWQVAALYAVLGAAAVFVALRSSPPALSDRDLSASPDGPRRTWRGQRGGRGVTF